MTSRNAGKATPETTLFLAMAILAVVAIAPDSTVLPANLLMVVLAVSVAITGLPHGALDPWLARRAGLWRGRRGWMVFNAAYVAVAGLVVALWWLVPGLSLAFFLAISAWHFGDDWHDHLPGWARILAGSALLVVPAWHWPTEVAWAFMVLAGADGGAIAAAFVSFAPWLAAGMVVSAGLAWRRSRSATLELAALIVLAVVVPPLVYFIVYFCALHSVRHLRLAARGADAPALRRMIAIAFAYTALTLAVAAAAWPWVKANASVSPPGDHLLRMVFVGLAALTLPHMLVVARSGQHRQRIR